MNGKLCLSLLLVSVLLLALLEDVSAKHRSRRMVKSEHPSPLRAKEGIRLSENARRLKVGDKALRRRWASLLKAKEFLRTRFAKALANRKPVEAVAAKSVTV